MGWKYAAVKTIDSSRTVMQSKVVYQRKIPMDMNEKNIVSRSKPNDGASHMSNGRIGELANLDSHTANAMMWTMETISTA